MNICGAERRKQYGRRPAARCILFSLRVVRFSIMSPFRKNHECIKIMADEKYRSNIDTPNRLLGQTNTRTKS
jgi:hypothetical protein